MKRQSLPTVFLSMSFAVVIAAGEAIAAIEPGCLFNDNMVLQRGKPVPVWGRATAGNEIHVRFAGECAKTVVGKDGCWRVDLPEMERFGRSNGNNVGCATLSDVGELDNIHPGDKRTVGTRLAALALNRIYGRKDLKCDAPVFASARLSEDGKKVTLSFSNVEAWNRNGTYEPRFELAGAEGDYVAVKAQYSASANTIDLIVPDGLVPEKVAYMRRSCVHGFIKNEAGLPLGPFRGAVAR